MINKAKEEQVIVESSEAEESMELLSQASKSSCENSQNSKGLAKVEQIEKFNSVLKMYGIDPIKQPSDSKAVKVEKLFNAINDDLGISQCSNGNDVVGNIRSAVNNVHNKAEKIKLLTLAPSSWSSRKIQDEFNVSRYLAEKSKSVKEEKGIYSSPDPAKPKKVTTEEQKKDIAEFYSEHCRHLPGKKDIKIVRINGEKVPVTKKLLLGTFKDLYPEYKEKYPHTCVGFTTFFREKPLGLVYAGQNGTHNVCVCQYHENCRLLLFSLKNIVDIRDIIQENEPWDYKTILKYFTCDKSEEDCWLYDDCYHFF